MKHQVFIVDDAVILLKIFISQILMLSFSIIRNYLKIFSHA